MAMSLGYGSSEEFYSAEYQTLDLRDKRRMCEPKKFCSTSKKVKQLYTSSLYRAQGYPTGLRFL